MTRELRHSLNEQPSVERKTEGPLAILAALRREAVFEAVISSCSVLLHSTRLRASLMQISERLGQAAAADRVHMFEIDPSPNSADGCIVWHHVWSAPGIPPLPTLGEAPEALVQLGLGEWVPKLRCGETIVSHTRDLDDSARKIFKAAGVKSALCIPVFANDHLWGMIGVDSCQSEREWFPAELTALETLAELIGETIVRTSNYQTRPDANRILENSPTILYRLSPKPPYPLIFVSQNVQHYGYKADELLESPGRWLDLVDRDHLPALIADVKSIAEGRKDRLLVEFRLRKPDGTYAWFERFGCARYDEHHRIVAIEGRISDITDRKSYEQRLTFINALLAAQLECSPDGILVVDDQAWIVSVNRRFLEMWQVPSELACTSLDSPVLPYTRHDEPVLAVVASHFKDSVSFTARVRYLYEHPNEESRDELETTDGRFIDRYTRPLRDLTGGRLGRIWFFRDVTDWKKAQNALRESEEKFRNIFSSVNDGIIIVDSAGNVVDINSSGCAMFGYSRGELKGLGIGVISSGVPPYTQATAMEWLADMQGQGPQTSEWQCKAKDGHLFWGEASLRGARFGAENFAVVTLRDITDRKKSQARIFQLARFDGLTGLANRATFLERLDLDLARARRGGSRFAILYLDLDHFKEVNDTLGHPRGDALLQAVADRLRDCVRKTDLVARFGGDEFAVLQDDIADASDAERLAIKINNELSLPYTIEGNQVLTTASIGIVPYGDDIAGSEAMMTKADLALYRAKDEGGNKFRFHASELDRQVRERATITEDLQGAIERKEFALWYQPQVDLASGSIVGLEALIRWNHPTRGLMLPAYFIPIAETSGYILAIGSWVIEQACRQLREWSDQHIAPPVYRSICRPPSSNRNRASTGLSRTISPDTT